ncbi:DUF4189 domain-containing protein [Sorangium atrum]|uniref:DUF4189 domain-containing protein n=1 Tax=Sorangium atrum TaxID=2995308 RepID=A0ABT5C940_9BACT|nr:DUF4189 domain-containing protein [Sorangium aterium]MDC0682473.1 DUF4189 domain-containing protein [Sorangium aterium]
MRVIQPSVHFLCTTAVILAVWPAAAANDSFGAIAYSTTSNRAATAQSWRSSDEAGRLALADCNRGSPAKDCFIAAAFQNACGALAIDDHGTWGAWWKSQSEPGGAGVSAALGVGRSRAREQCRRYAAGHAAECRVVAELCAVAFHP